MSDCIFCKIVKKEIPAKILYENDDVIVFPDISPAKPVHLLVIPKKHIPDFIALSDDLVLKKIRVAIQEMVKKQGLLGKGYRVLVNGGGAQAVDHLHFHILGPMGKAVKI